MFVYDFIHIFVLISFGLWRHRSTVIIPPHQPH